MRLVITKCNFAMASATQDNVVTMVNKAGEVIPYYFDQNQFYSSTNTYCNEFTIEITGDSRYAFGQFASSYPWFSTKAWPE